MKSEIISEEVQMKKMSQQRKIYIRRSDRDDVLNGRNTKTATTAG